jgi:rhodanese-related sulfurtransferase
MRSIILSVLLAVVVTATAVASNYTNITSTQAKVMLDKGGIYLLDVRTPQEYQQGHLQGAVLIPLDQIEKRFVEIPKNRKILIYCAVGSRSNAAAGFLAGKGYKDIYNMKDGIVGWHRKGFPIVH